MRLLFAVLLLLIAALVAAASLESLTDADLDQVAEQVLSELNIFRKAAVTPKSTSPKKQFRKKRVSTLSDSETSAARMKVTIDHHSNEHWIQLRISPAKCVSAQVILKTTGQVFAAANADWDHGKRMNFVGKPGDKIPYGTPVTIKCFLNTGGEATVPMTWRRGAVSGKSNSGSGKTKGNGGKKNGGGSSSSSSANAFWKKPSSKNPLVQSAIKKARAFKRSGGGPQAHLTGEDSLRRRNKQKLNAACNSMGINDLKTRAMIFALFTLETEQMYDWSGQAQRDTSKDGDWMSKNYSPVNMNVDMLQNYLKIPKSKFESLNKLSNIKQTLTVVLRGLQKLGLEGFLNFHRGGRTGYQKPSTPKFKIPVFKDGVYNIMQKYIQDPTLFTDGRKAWANIPHV